MPLIHPCELPGDALLRKYREAGAYTDCFATDISRPVSHAEYIEAFYTTWVFKLERRLLAWFVAKPSTDSQASELASGERQFFAAWNVEARSIDQLLMCDFRGRTLSWLMTVAVPGTHATSTRLYFGSAVVPAHKAASGRREMGLAFRILLGFHKVYSRMLLQAAKARLLRHHA